MAGNLCHARGVNATEEYVRATLSNLGHIGDDPEQISCYRREFSRLVRLARFRAETVRTHLNRWRQEVRTGDVDWSVEQENDFKESLAGVVSMADLLIEKFDRSGIFLMKPRLFNPLQTARSDARRNLDTWQSPEWETTNERTVLCSEEQMKSLRAKIESCN